MRIQCNLRKQKMLRKQEKQMPLSGGLLGTLLVRMHRNDGNAADKGNEGALKDLLRMSPARPERPEFNKKYTNRKYLLV